MLATVECKDAPGGMKTFFKDLFSLPEIDITKQSVPEGDDYYRVTVTEYRGQIPVAETAEKLKRLKGSVIFDINFPYDENVRCLEFHPEALPSILLFNTFIDYMKGLSLPAEKISLTVYDKIGVYADTLEQTVGLFSKIEVYTENLTAYQKTTEVLMDKFGLSLPVAQVPTGKAPKSTVVLCPGRVPFTDFFEGLLFTDCDLPVACSCKVSGYDVLLPSCYELLRPQGIDRLTFASALYEKCNVSSLGKLGYRKIKVV